VNGTSDAGWTPHSGDRIVVRTPDRREFRGVVVELTVRGVVIRLDTGWVTTYPLLLVHRDEIRHTEIEP